MGRYTGTVRDTWHDIIWSDRLETVSEIKLSHIERDHFVRLEDAKAMAEKKHQRWHTQERRRVLLGDAYKSIALRYIKRQPKMRTCKFSDIERVVRCGQDGQGAGYEITARGTRFTIGGKRN